MKKNTATKLICATAVILIAVILLVLNVTVLAPERHKGEKTVSILIEYSDVTYEYRDLKTDTETVYDLLKEYDKALELQMKTKPSSYGGEYLIGLKGAEIDEQAGIGYAYTVNGQYATGISSQPIADGDVIKFSYAKTTYDENWVQTSFTLMPGSGFRDSGVSAGYVVVWVCCAVAMAAGIAVLVFTFVPIGKKSKPTDVGETGGSSDKN